MEKLTEIQQKLKAPKDQFNSFGYYKYRSCEDILEAIKPLLNGCSLTISDTMVNLGDRYYVAATAYFSDGEKNKTVTAYAREQEVKKGMDAAQITRSCSSYARKYALNGLFLIDDTKDADTMDNDKHEHKDKPPPKKEQHKKRDYITGEEKEAPKMTRADWTAIQGIGYNFDIDNDEIKKIVRWKCDKEKIKASDIKVLEYFVPYANFDKTLGEYREGGKP